MPDLCDPVTQKPLSDDGTCLKNENGRVVAVRRGGIPRFVTADENYAENFGWQWKHWENVRSRSRGNAVLDLRSTILERTRFAEYNMDGKTILECGMGGGDDTEVLLGLPFAEIHAFDLSSSVERAAKYLETGRLYLSQASIFHIPYADESFDFVFCHRVLQHTPDPVLALRCVCAKVKPGGILFAHAYKRSLRYMLEWKYKYRWLTKRLPHRWIFHFLEHFGPTLHDLNEYLWTRSRLTRRLAYNFVPFYRRTSTAAERDRLELEKLVTFDAMTPWHDHPMRSTIFRRVIEQEGFRIEHLHDPLVSPIYATAVKTRGRAT